MRVFTDLFSQMLLLNVANKIPLLLGLELAVVVCIGNCARALPHLLFQPVLHPLGNQACPPGYRREHEILARLAMFISPQQLLLLRVCQVIFILF